MLWFGVFFLLYVNKMYVQMSVVIMTSECTVGGRL